MASLQDTVRAYDTKAQIVGVGNILAIRIITQLGSLIDNMPELSLTTISFTWLVVIFPIALFGAVLYPTRKVAPSLGKHGGHAKRVYYTEPEHVHDVSAYLTAVEDSDLKIEIAYEILKTSSLREIKRLRFLRALWAAAVSFIIIFLGQLLRSEGLLPF